MRAEHSTSGSTSAHCSAVGHRVEHIDPVDELVSPVIDQNPVEGSVEEEQWNDEGMEMEEEMERADAEEEDDDEGEIVEDDVRPEGQQVGSRNSEDHVARRRTGSPRAAQRGLSQEEAADADEVLPASAPCGAAGRRGEEEYPPEVEGQEEGCRARGLPSPARVSRREREEHNRTHTPFRSWRDHCSGKRHQDAASGTVRGGEAGGESRGDGP